MRNSIVLLAETVFATREPALADALVNEMLYILTLTEEGDDLLPVIEGISNILANPSEAGFDFSDMADEDQLTFILYDIANQWIESADDAAVELSPETASAILLDRFKVTEE